MKTYLSSYWLFYLVGTIFFIPSLYATPLTYQDPTMVNDLFSNTKPQCIGVYIVDVPESFKNSTNKATYDDFKIESKFIYPPAFKQRVDLREQELYNAINTPGNELKNAPFIKEIIQLPNNQGIIFDRNQNRSDDSYRTLEAHVYINHIAFIITTNILDLSDSKYVDERKSYLDLGFNEIRLNDKPIKLAALRSLISRLNGRLDHEIPTDKGTCIPNGFIADDGKKHEISVGLSYDNNDFLLTTHMDNKVKADNKKKFNRDDEMKESLKYSYMKFIKKYNIKPNNIPAEVWFLKGIQTYDKNTMQVYEFNLYANDNIASVQNPWLAINLNSQYKQTRYSEKQIVEIWDKIVGSLRYKPNAF